MQHKALSIAEYIDGNVSKPYTVDELAGLFNISKYYLCHVFKEQTGHTLMDYVAIRRIERAQTLMLEGSSSTEAGFAVGYNNYSVFFKHFKRHTGKTPRQFLYAAGRRQGA